MIEFILFHGRSSRLYQRLVYRDQLATELGGGVHFRKDPSLFMARSTARPGVPIERLRDTIYEELDRLTKEEVTEDELAKVRRAIEADFIFSQESHYELAHNLGAEECRSSWRDYMGYLEENLRVTAADITRVASAIFREQGRTVGYLVPESMPAVEAVEAVNA